MSQVTKSDHFERAINEAESLFEQVSIARAEAENAESYLKSVKAIQFIAFKDGNEKISATEAEQRALASPEYQAARKDWRDKNITWRTLEGRAKAKELRFEAWRTANATKRAKMQLR